MHNGLITSQVGGGEDGPAKGTKENPYTVTEVIALNNPGTPAWVRGYIIGVIKNNNLVSGSGSDVQTNLALGDAVGVTDEVHWIPVELPNTTIRTNLNLVAHANYIGAEVLLYGNLEKYFGIQGMKSTSDYELISIQKSTPTLYFEPATYEATVGETFTATLVNTDGVEVSYSIETEPSGCATIANTGEVTCSAVGTAIVTATSVETDDFISTTASYILNIVAINQKPAKYKKITSSAEFDLKGTYIIVCEEGNMAMGDVNGKGTPIDVTISEDKLIETNFVNKAGYPYEVTFSNATTASKYYLNLSGGRLTTKDGKTDISLSPEGGEFSVAFTEDGDANIQCESDRQIRYSASNKAFRDYSTSDNASKIVQLYKKVETVAVGTAGWATFAPSSNVAMPDQQNVGVYYVTTVGSDDVATTSDARDVISDGYYMAAGTGVLVKAAAGTTVCFPVSSETDEGQIMDADFLGNLLVGVIEKDCDAKTTGNVDGKNLDDVQNAYIFAKREGKVGFYVSNGGVLAINKCYLQWSAPQQNAPKFIMLPGDDMPTAIDEVLGGGVDMPMYDLQGRRVTSGYRGMVISNGKKIMTK